MEWSKQFIENSPWQCNEVQCLLDITSLNPAFFRNGDNVGRTKNRYSRIYLVTDREMLTFFWWKRQESSLTAANLCDTSIYLKTKQERINSFRRLAVKQHATIQKNRNSHKRREEWVQVWLVGLDHRIQKSM